MNWFIKNIIACFRGLVISVFCLTIRIIKNVNANYIPDTHQETIDDNLTNTKPTERWRLNSNGFSQRYVRLEGNDRVERMKSLMNHYGFDGEDSWYTIRTVARIHHIYPEVIICIAYADSSLGKFLKTEHNYGNVGNNDRGDRVSYTSFEQGMNAIGKVLNNRNLGHYTTINELSRRGNQTGMIYASSTENRHNNVLNCIGMIHDKGIVDDFAFRF